MNRAGALIRVVPLLAGLVLSLSACADGPQTGDRGRDAWNGWRGGPVWHASFARHGSPQGGERGDTSPAPDPVLLAPLPFTVIRPFLPGEAHDMVARY
jgi:hypothetical protein